MSAPTESATAAAHFPHHGATAYARVAPDSCGSFVHLETQQAVSSAKLMFANVVVQSVTVHILQVHVEPSVEVYTPKVLFFGIVPTGIATAVNGKSVVGLTPHLQTFVTQHCGNAQSHTWGEGGTPFPPGLQLELSAAQVRGRYPCVLVGYNHTPTGKEEVADVSVRVTYKLACDGAGFGNVA